MCVVLVVTLVLNLAAGLIKLLASSDSGSLALAAGGIDSLFDGAANLIGIMAVRVAARPPDVSHPYGHRKFETLVAVGIIVLLFVTCVRLVQMALPRLWVQDAVPIVEWYTIAAVLVAMTLNLIASQHEARWWGAYWPSGPAIRWWIHCWRWPSRVSSRTSGSVLRGTPLTYCRMHRPWIRT